VCVWGVGLWMVRSGLTNIKWQ